MKKVPKIDQEGHKEDTEKIRYDLIPPLALRELASVYTLGAKKYGSNNYRKGIKWSRIYGAIMRHLEAWRMGEEEDPEEGNLHLASAAWGCMTLIEYGNMQLEFDDREEYWGTV